MPIKNRPWHLFAPSWMSLKNRTSSSLPPTTGSRWRTFPEPLVELARERKASAYTESGKSAETQQEGVSGGQVAGSADTTRVGSARALACWQSCLFERGRGGERVEFDDQLKKIPVVGRFLPHFLSFYAGNQEKHSHPKAMVQVVKTL